VRKEYSPGGKDYSSGKKEYSLGEKEYSLGEKEYSPDEKKCPFSAGGHAFSLTTDGFDLLPV
jgi:hypothetical protein